MQFERGCNYDPPNNEYPRVVQLHRLVLWTKERKVCPSYNRCMASSWVSHPPHHNRQHHNNPRGACSFCSYCSSRRNVPANRSATESTERQHKGGKMLINVVIQWKGGIGTVIGTSTSVVNGGSGVFLLFSCSCTALPFITPQIHMAYTHTFCSLFLVWCSVDCCIPLSPCTTRRLGSSHYNNPQYFFQQATHISPNNKDNKIY